VINTDKCKSNNCTIAATVIPLIYEKLEDTKAVIRSCNSKKDRLYNDQNKKDKQ
jgi:hypothetical protein